MSKAGNILKLIESVEDRLKKILTADDIKKLKLWIGGKFDIESSNLYDKLYKFYFELGELPINVAKGRTEDPLDWIFDRIQKDLNL